jgi:hypothetical protein
MPDSVTSSLGLEAIAASPTCAELAERVVGTTIDPATMLSTDYFNTFNEVIMLLGMAPDMPEIVEEIYGWKSKTYAEHFSESSLGFALLAIELYSLAPEARRKRLEGLIELMSWTVYEAQDELRALLEAGSTKIFAARAREYSDMLQRLVDFGSAIVHGRAGASEQASIDELFD